MGQVVVLDELAFGMFGVNVGNDAVAIHHPGTVDDSKDGKTSIFVKSLSPPKKCRMPDRFSSVKPCTLPLGNHFFVPNR